MNILITDFFSAKNKGDAAIASVTIDIVRKSFPEAKLKLVTSDKVETEDKFEGVELIQSLFYEAVYTSNSTIIRILKTIYLFLSIGIWTLVYKSFSWKFSFLNNKSINYLLDSVIEADLVIAKGGGYITADNSYRATIGLLIQLFALWLSTALKKPVILFPQSIGPFETRFQKLLTKFVLNKVQMIFCRETYTLDTLAKLGITKPKIFLSADVALIYESDTKEKMKTELAELGVDLSRPLVGITTTHKLKNQSLEKYENVIADLITYLVEQKIQVIIIPQVTSLLHNDDDRFIQESVRQRLPENILPHFLNKEYSTKDIKGIYENLDYLVGTRMHSVIFALTAQVPSIAISYSYKTNGLMESLELGEWCVNIGNMESTELVNLFDKLQDSSEYYKTVLSRTLKLNTSKITDISEFLKRINSNIYEN